MKHTSFALPPTGINYKIMIRPCKKRKMIKLLPTQLIQLQVLGLPYQKRFFDAFLQWTIPVVVSRELMDIGKTYWSNVNSFGKALAHLDQIYPPLPSDVSYSDLVIEVDGSVIKEGGLMKRAKYKDAKQDNCYFRN